MLIRIIVAHQSLTMSTIHHPTGITVEIVGIEANSNGQSCYQHDVCGELVEEDVVLRLRKVQILNSLGREETAIAAYHVSDGIDQCRVGFLQRHFVAHAKTFDGVLAQVTEVYSVGSDSPIKRKKCRHNMGCCLAALISDFPLAEKCTTTFLAKTAKGEEDSTQEIALLNRSAREDKGFVSYDDPGASIDASMTHNGNVPDYSKTGTGAPPPQQCHTPPTKEANQSAKKRRAVIEINDLMPSRHSNRIVEKIALAQKNVAAQRKKAPIAAAGASTGKRKVQSNSTGRKKVATAGKNGEEESLVDSTFSAAPAAATVSTAKKKAAKGKKRFGAPDKEKVRLEELEVRYTTIGTKVYANFSVDSDDEDYVASADES
jgi:hypothetical protein